MTERDQLAIKLAGMLFHADPAKLDSADLILLIGVIGAAMERTP